MVGNVEDLPPEVHMYAFVDVKGFEHRSIHDGQPRTHYVVAPGVAVSVRTDIRDEAQAIDKGGQVIPVGRSGVRQNGSDPGGIRPARAVGILVRPIGATHGEGEAALKSQNPA